MTIFYKHYSYLLYSITNFGLEVFVKMEIYQHKSRWKIVLASVGLLILLATLIYSNYLSNKLEESEQKNIVLFKMSIDKILNDPNYDADYELAETIRDFFSLPCILESDQGTLMAINFGPEKDEDSIFLRKKIEEFKAAGKVPLENRGYSKYIYYFNSPLLARIKYFPLFQVLLVGMFIVLGYYLFSTSRKSEQNQVWAGMAKETAHQLGTPISAIMAWIEHLKMTPNLSLEQSEIVGELTNDVNRLELIADRFSKIGSDPKLETTNIYDELQKCKNYMQKRAARKVSFYFPEPQNTSLTVNINQHLFDWVIENLIRNSLDSMDGQGEISGHIYEEENYICIDISDTGKGIAPSNFKTVFQPGFTTKKRGWGLGLSLAKRIIENYHKGKIFVKNSKLNEGTCFTIKLPKIS